MRDQWVIAIDGPAGSGKSTVAKRLAQRLDGILLDTGAIYRSVALIAKRRGIDWADEPELERLARELKIAFRLEGDLNRVLVDGDDVTQAIRTSEISQGASRVSALPGVRRALLDLQRAVAQEGEFTVAEGRDMGTVVFPGAAVKVFLDADPLERARRRHRELILADPRLELDQVLREQNARDEADSNRAVAPLLPAPDAEILDTSGLEIPQVVSRILDLVKGRQKQEAWKLS